MPQGKPAGQPCIHLQGDDYRCQLFGQSSRPACCSGLQPSPEMCGDNREQALAWLHWLEKSTA